MTYFFVSTLSPSLFFTGESQEIVIDDSVMLVALRFRGTVLGSLSNEQTNAVTNLCVLL